MNPKEILKSEYGMECVIEVVEMIKSHCYRVNTGHEFYVLKRVGRLDFVRIYDKVQEVLRADGWKQARIIPALNGGLLSTTGWCLMDYTAGDALERYDEQQFSAIVQIMRSYNTSLAKVPFRPEEIEVLNSWDRVSRVSWMCEQVEALAEQRGLNPKERQLLRNAAKLLSANLDFFHSSPKQLIHADLGPGNIIFQGGRVVSVIDFTPEYENELYALSQFLYWTCLWGFQQANSVQRISDSLALYFGVRRQQVMSPKHDLFLYLVKSALFRTLGPSLAMLEAGTFDFKRIKGRLEALEALLDIQPNIT